MKKLLSILMCLIIMLSFAACGDASTGGNGPSTFGLNETSTYDGVKYTALEIKESNGSDFFVPDEGKVFLGVKFSIENTSEEEQNISSMLMFEGYVDDVVCDYSLSAASHFDDGTLDGTIAPGKKLVGWYAVEIPKDYKKFELQISPDMFSEDTLTFVYEK